MIRFFWFYQKKINCNEQDSLHTIKIKKGECYSFDLVDKKKDSNVLYGIRSYLHIKGGKRQKSFEGLIDGETRIKYRKKYHYKIYETKNLAGLFYINGNVSNLVIEKWE